MKTAILAVATLIVGASAAYAQSPANSTLQKQVNAAQTHEQKQAVRDAAFRRHQDRVHDMAVEGRKTGNKEELAQAQAYQAADVKHTAKQHERNADFHDHTKAIYGNKTR